MLNIVDRLWAIHNDPSSNDGHTISAQVDPGIDLRGGQELQLQLLQRWLDTGERIGGWKIGMTSGASRNAMGEGVRPFGFILESRIKTAADKLSVAKLHRGQVENELCFLFGHTIGAGATANDARAAVSHVLPAFEINQKRLPPGAPTGLRIADNLSNWGICIGEPVAPPSQLNDLTVAIFDENKLIETVSSVGHIDDHYESLAALARSLSEHGHTISPGQYVITGAYGKTPFAPGIYTGQFSDGIGEVKINLVR